MNKRVRHIVVLFNNSGNLRATAYRTKLDALSVVKKINVELRVNGTVVARYKPSMSMEEFAAINNPIG